MKNETIGRIIQVDSYLFSQTHYHEQDVTQGQFFKWSKDCLNSKFSCS